MSESQPNPGASAPDPASWYTRSLLVGVITCGVFLMATPTRVAATHDSLNCQVPSAMEPLFELLDTITQLLVLAGISLATLGFVVAAILILGPFGPDYAERGRQVAKQTFLGLILLFGAEMIVSFVVSQSGGVFCP